MSLCINPSCSKPQNSDDDLFCQTCGTELLMEGQFRVMRMLGAGGCGKTYEVSDRAGHLKVLKILSNNAPKYVELFQREAFLLSHLKHPGIPSVERNAYFTTQPKNNDHPLHCLVMQKIVGLDLHKYLRQRGQPIEQKLAWQWMIQLAEILKTIHHQNILHRDIKPSNIMLKADGNLALVDFGTARSITNVYDNDEPVPATRVISALYTPDEQMKGHPVTQSDFFALGRTFIYLLTAKDLGEFYDPLTSEFDWSETSQRFLPLFVALINRLMAPLPAHRPATATEILHQLHQLEPELFANEPREMNMAYAQTQLATRAQSLPESQPINPLEPQPNNSQPNQHPNLSPPLYSNPPSSPQSTPVYSGQPSAPEFTPPYEKKSTEPVSTALPQEFIDLCQRHLARLIGPIAKILCQQTLNQQKNWTQQDYIEALASRIQDPNSASEFKQVMRS